MNDTETRAKRIFFEALEQSSPAAITEHIAKACGDDVQLRERVEQLLRAHQDAGNFLGGSGTAPTVDQPVEEGNAPTVDPPLAELPGMQIGPYKLLQEIGEGGMGTVYMAEQQEPVRRKVALKIIKPGMDGRQVIARFEAERQALAIMDHHNIAKVLDAGTTEFGRPFFVMELIRGVPITRYCDEHRLTIRERLGLFVPLCRAVQHAHQKGIIHRDIKPSNVQVCHFDGQPVPKVIDFGVAKAVEHRLTEKTLFTQFGQVIGTVEYMSPEQAGFSQLDVDTRSDIYSLGVLLYELLTGTTPLTKQRLREAGFDEMIRLVREEEPQKPSTRLSGFGDALPTISAQRRTEPNKLDSLVRGDLDWIVMKALEKDRTRRYETANGIARDIERHLANEPVEACSPSAAYRLRKFAQRNRTAPGTTILVTLALATGMVVAIWQASEARKNADTARRHENDALAAKADLEDSHQALQRSKDEIERSLARSLLLPLARDPGPITDLEIEYLSEIRRHGRNTLWRISLEEALRDPKLTAQLKNRSEIALHAAVGLDLGKRMQAERLLRQWLQNPTLSDSHRCNVALIAVSLRGLTPSGKAEVGQTIIEIMTRVSDPSVLQELAHGLSSLVTLMEPEQAKRICSEAANILCNALANTLDSGFEPIAKGLSVLAPHVEPDGAVRICSDATAFLTDTKHRVGSAVELLAPFVDRDRAASFAERWRRSTKSTVLVVLAARMERADAIRICSEEASETTGLLKHEKALLVKERLSLARRLWALAPFLESEVAAKAAMVFVDEVRVMINIGRENDDSRVYTHCLAALAPHLDSSTVKEISRVVAGELANAKNSVELSFCLDCLEAIAPHMNAEQVAQLYSPATYSHLVTGHSRLIEGFSKAVIRMEPLDATALLLNAMTKAEHPSELEGFASTLSIVAARIEAQESARICKQAASNLEESLAKWEGSFRQYALGEVAKAIGLLAPFLDRREADRICSSIIASVTETLVKAQNERAPPESLAEGLASLAGYMQPNEAMKSAEILQTVLAQRWRRALGGKLSPSEYFDPHSWVKALAVVARRLNPTESASVCSIAATMTLEGLAREPGAYYLARALASLAARMEPEDAARICDKAGAIIFDSMTTTPHPNARANLALGIVALTPHMKSAVSAKLRVEAAQILAKSLVTRSDLLFDDAAYLLNRLTNALLALIVGTEQREPGREGDRWRFRLPPQDMVELLKHLTCVGQARGIVLEQLGSHFKRSFADQWAFAEYVEGRDLGLDLVSPAIDFVPQVQIEKN